MCLILNLLCKAMYLLCYILFEIATWFDVAILRMSLLLILSPILDFSQNINLCRRCKTSGKWNVECSSHNVSFLLTQVAAAVYSCDMKKLFVTMRDGFPSEYVVSTMARPVYMH